jgi:Tol biopolymer transport system component
MKSTNKARLVGGLLLPLIVCFVSYGKTSSGKFGSLAISPDGKLIAINFEQGNTSFIYEIAVDTGVATRLTKAKAGVESSPAFSSDGKRIAFTYWPADHRRSRIVIVNVDGSDLHQWSPSGNNDVSPVFSPDNKTIIFGRFGFYGSYSPVAQPHPHEWDFFASDLDGANVRQLTHESFYGVSPASVSSDGKSMVVVVEGLEISQQIAVYSLDQPGKQSLSLQPHVPQEVDHKNPIFAYPNYLPDGSILFMAANKRFDYDVYRLNPDTGTIEKLTNGNGYATDLRVSADGRTAALLKWRKNRIGEVVSNEIYLLDLQSHALTPLVVTGLN